MISLLVPSRGRPTSFLDMAITARGFARDKGAIEIIPWWDLDDPELDEYERVADMLGIDGFAGERGTLSSLWNHCASHARGEILMQCADDIRFRTRHWDDMVRNAFRQYPDRIVYVYGRDGIADERMATHGFMHRAWYETTGFFTWPEFSSDYGDLWNHTIAERLGRLHFLPDLYTEHLHPAAGKWEYDQTHLDRLARDEADKNADRWEACQQDLETTVEKLRARLGEPLEAQSPTGR